MIPRFKFFFVAILPSTIVLAEWSTRECNWDLQCEALYRPGSKCLEGGVCSNPYTAGCLHNFYDHTDQEDTAKSFLLKRTCNSNDITPENCEPPVLHYHEVRVHNTDWESGIVNSWIIQVFLSEFLHVPTTVGLNNEDSPQASFYAPTMQMSYSAKSDPWEELVTANEMGGRCELTDTDCVHVMPEVWNSQEKRWTEYLTAGHIDQVSGTGEIGKGSWYIPYHTAKQHPDLTSFHGLSGQREKLASIFNRPTTWGEYCELVSPTKCTTDDAIAVRLPANEDEESRYYHDGLFTGFFRPTDKNNCTLNPDTCSGHIVDSSCDWDSDAFAQAYWNDIAMESDGPLPENSGYSYEQMIDIWRAANATKSDVAMFWWTLEPLIEEFQGTQYQFQPILMPEPSAQCHAARIDPADRCNPDPLIRRGPEGGACDQEPFPLQKIVASSLRDMTLATPEVDRSPGYQSILNLKVSTLDINTILKAYVDGGWSGYAARQAVCEWVIEHQKDLETFIPRGYPRVFAKHSYYSRPLLHAAIGFGGAAILYVLLAAGMVCWYSTAKVFVYAQVPFVFMVLFGMFLVACGSIFFALEPQNSICVSQKWFITLGYTFELVPLLVKIAAINRVVVATRRMKHVRISMRSLFFTVVAVVLVVMVFMTLWTVLDSPQRHEDRYLKGVNTITTAVVCASDSGFWDLLVLCWSGVLILCATVLAFQSRDMKEEFNDSKSLGTMIYSHFIFAVLRVVALSLSGMQISEDENNGGYPPIEPSTLAAASSFLLSADVIAAVTIYVVPKLVSARKAPQAHRTNHGVTLYNINSDGAGHSKSIPIKGASQEKRASVVPSSDERRVNGERRGPSRQVPSGALCSGDQSFDSGHMRVGMDGNVQTDEEQDPSSSNDEDWGGPRFASPSAALQAGSTPTAIHSIEEGRDESTNSIWENSQS